MRSFIGWLGGKSALAGEIVSYFPPHKTYIEVFGGAAWVMFKKTPAPDMEVYNDLNGDIANLFRVVKHRHSELVERVLREIYSRQLHKEMTLKWQLCGEVCELERAASFLILIKSSFGSKPGHGWAQSRRNKKVLINPGLIERVHERLQNVYVENRSFELILPAYDTDTALFYLDPPYADCATSKHYQHPFTDSDHQKLAESIAKLKGKWILSYGDCEMIRDLYSGHHIKQTGPLAYTTSNNTGVTNKERRELLISNFPLEAEEAILDSPQGSIC